MPAVKNLVSHSISIAFVTGCIFFAALYLIGPTVLEQILVVKSPVRKVDALVVMAGARHHRLPAALELFRQGVAPKILLTNDGMKGPYSFRDKKNLYLVEWAREYLLEKGVPEDAIVLLNFTQSGSYFDALNTRAYVQNHDDIGSLLVVTSHYHTRRTLWTFKRIFQEMNVRIGVYPVPKDPGNKSRLFKTMIIELGKLFYYQIRYGTLT